MLCGSGDTTSGLLAVRQRKGQHLVGDRSRPEGLAQALGRRRFEAIVDLAAFQPGEVRDAVELFRDSVRRYVFVSSGAVYQRGTGSDEEQAPILEGDPPEYELDYAMGKRWCESVLARAIGDGFPGVVLRPPPSSARTITQAESPDIWHGSRLGGHSSFWRGSPMLQSGSRGARTSGSRAHASAKGRDEASPTTSALRASRYGPSSTSVQPRLGSDNRP
jgi:hypothetical protein